MKMMSWESSIAELGKTWWLVESKEVKVYSLDLLYTNVHDIKYGRKDIDESSEWWLLESMKVNIGQSIIEFVEKHKLQDYTFIPIPSTQWDFLKDILLEIKVPLVDLLEMNPSVVGCTKNIDKEGVERKRFASEKYYVKSLPPKHIILVDDIYQTGSTCDAICEKIFWLDDNVEIIFLCLCVVK